jgi:hypothetical protein
MFGSRVKTVLLTLVPFGTVFAFMNLKQETPSSSAKAIGRGGSLTENQLDSFYLSIWKSNKAVLTPILIYISYTLTIFLIGYWFGKRR